MSELYRDFIDRKADEIINDLGGTITPAPANAELYRDFLDRKFDDVINAIGNAKIKKFEYTGDGNIIHDVLFPTTPKYILGIYGELPNYHACCMPFYYGCAFGSSLLLNIGLTNAPLQRTINLTYNSNNTITIEGNSQNYALNTNNVEYTVYYI